jgi:Ca2+-binding RTX toxin-like protein
MARSVPSLAIVLFVLFVTANAGSAIAKTSHAGWPTIDGVLKMHKRDQNGHLHGTSRSDELLGGHGSDTLWGRNSADVLWGDYKPSGQNTWQVDHLYGGAGNDFIYASHGRNVIDAGAGNDYVKGHFGHGVIDCGSGNDVVYVSHRGRKGWKIRHCERISYKTLGY